MKKLDLDKTVREAITQSGESQYRLSLNSGVSQGAISRFMNRNRTLTLRSASRVLAALGISVKLEKREE
jgi:transcriptional regulator with XRE-family HTH domain